MGFGGVIVDCGRGLGSQVASFCVEVERADAVITTSADKPHATLDALDSVSFHRDDCKCSDGEGRHASGVQLR
jgi:hypothetical protein